MCLTSCILNFVNTKNLVLNGNWWRFRTMDQYLCHLNSLHLADIYSLYGVSCLFISYAEGTMIKQDKER